MTSTRDTPDKRGTAWLILAVIGFVGFALLTVAVWNQATQALDQELLSRVAPLSAFPTVWNFFSELGNYPMIPIGLGYAGWLWWKGRHREAIAALLLFGLATAVSEGVKAIVARPRPQGGGAGIPGVVYSFPSGHSLEDLMIFGMIALTLWRNRQPAWQKWLFLAFTVFEVVMVSIARVALAVHYPSDMLGGILVASGILGLYGWLTRPGGWADRPPRSWR
jgi:membrane-associated phospholipid phosphatase